MGAAVSRLNGEVARVAGEAAGDHHARQRRLHQRWCGAAEDAPDEADLDRLGFTGLVAACTRSGPHFFTRPNSA